MWRRGLPLFRPYGALRRLKHPLILRSIDEGMQKFFVTGFSS
jgi:hypothetical protein